MIPLPSSEGFGEKQKTKKQNRNATKNREKSKPRKKDPSKFRKEMEKEKITKSFRKTNDPKKSKSLESRWYPQIAMKETPPRF